MKPLISIIIPVYGVEKYLKRCVDSVLGQSYTDTEIILVDDGSPDGCPSICDEYAAADRRVNVIHKQNGGLSSARNCGIEASHGELIMLVDSDDYILPDMCERLYAALDGGCDMAICGINNISEDGTPLAELNAQSPFSDCVIDRDVCYRAMLGSGYWYWVVAWNKLYRRTLFDNVRYPEGKQHEDEFVIHRLMYGCSKIAVISDRLYNYVHRGESIMTKQYTVNRLDGIEALFDRVEFYIENRIDKEIIVKGLSGCLKELGRTFRFSNRHEAQFRLRYKTLYKSYRRLFFKVFCRKMPVAYRLFFALAFVSPYLACKILSIKAEGC